MSGEILSKKELTGFPGVCLKCGELVASYTCNAEILDVRPEAAHWDYWYACTNGECMNHQGEGAFLDATMLWWKPDTIKVKPSLDSCQCIDCGGNEPGHSSDCKYMAEISGYEDAVIKGLLKQLKCANFMLETSCQQVALLETAIREHQVQFPDEPLEGEHKLWRPLDLDLSIPGDSIVGSCTCLTKTPDISYHSTGCKYRLIVERNMARAELAAFRRSFDGHVYVKNEEYAELCRAARELARQQEGLDELRQWKAEALKSFPDWQVIGEELNLHIGADVKDHILPGIRALKHALRELLAQEHGASMRARKLLQGTIE